jgi:hypothetical protein
MPLVVTHFSTLLVSHFLTNTVTAHTLRPLPNISESLA